MELSSWLLFAAVATVNVISPGPAILLAITNSIAYGLKHTISSSLGNMFGLLFISLISMFGVGAILQASALLFTIVKITGAFYLIYLGIKQLRKRHSLIQTQDTNNNKTLKQCFKEGLLVALTNPKAILFFTALFPQFLDTNIAIIPQFSIMTLTFMLISLGSLLGYGCLFRFAQHWFSRESRMQWFQRITGGIFVSLGLGLLSASTTNR